MTATPRTSTVLPRRAVLGLLGAAAALAAGLVGPAAAANDPIDLQIVDRETGQVMRTWSHGGRLFVAGRTGARYALRVTNNTSGRVMVVMSIDGVNIYTGETAGYSQGGYILDPWETYDLTGWRKSTTEVAAFTFAPIQKSYAARTGRPTDVGVIGLAMFKERAAPVVKAPRGSEYYNSAPRSAGRGGGDLYAPLPAPPPSVLQPREVAPQQRSQDSAGAAAPLPAPERRTDKLGTGHGEREYSAIRLENFERATSYPQFTRQIEYDTYQNLVTAGVIPRSPPPPARPRPFPTEPRFVPDPPR